MKLKRRMLAALLAGAMLFSLAACSKDGEGGEGGGQGGEGSEGGYSYNVLERGRYVEIDITPDGMDVSPYSFYSNADGLYDFYGMSYGSYENNYQNTYKRYRSTDRGATWQQVDMSWTEQYIDNWNWDDGDPIQPLNQLNNTMAIMDDGSILTATYAINYENYTRENFRFLRVALDGTVTNPVFEGLEIVNDPTWDCSINEMRYLGSNRLYLSMWCYQTDEDGYWLDDKNITGIYDVETGAKAFDLISLEGYMVTSSNTGMLYADYDGNMTVIDLTDGSVMKTNLPNENEFYGGSLSNYSPWNSMLTSDYGLICFGDLDAVRIKNEPDSEPEVIMNALNYSYGSPLQYMNWVGMDGQDEMVMVLGDRDGGYKIVRFEWDDNAIAKTDAVIKVFALYDNYTARLALSQFKLDHPEVEVEYTYALERYYYDDENPMTVEDALRNLNNELLTGNGPDVLILDEMPVQSYIDKGILADISTAVEGTGIYEQLLEPYRDGNKLYVVPTRFTVPLLFGRAGQVEDVDNLDAIVQAIVDGPDRPADVYRDYGNWDWDSMTNEERISYYETELGITPWEQRPTFRFDGLGEVASMFFEISAPSIYTESDGLNVDALRDYMQAVKQVSDKYMLAAEPDAEVDVYYGAKGGNYGIAQGGSIMMGWSANFQQFISGNARMGFSQISAFTDMTSLADMGYYANRSFTIDGQDGEELEINISGDVYDVGIKLANGMASNVYVPRSMAGVTDNSKAKALAIDFVTSMLAMGVQGYNMYDGLPVTEAGLAKEYSAYMTVQAWMVEQNTEPVPVDYQNLFGTLNTPYYINTYLLQTIYEYLEPYCQGSMDLDSAVQQVVTDTEMYFAERQ